MFHVCEFLKNFITLKFVKNDGMEFVFIWLEKAFVPVPAVQGLLLAQTYKWAGAGKSEGFSIFYLLLHSSGHIVYCTLLKKKHPRPLQTTLLNYWMNDNAEVHITVFVFSIIV